MRRRIRAALAEIVETPAETQREALDILNRAADELTELARRGPSRTV
jgi:replicative DNA helicase